MILRDFSPLRDGLVLDKGVNLDLARGDIATVMGPSGVGKTSLLGAIAGDLAHGGFLLKDLEHFRIYQDADQLFPWYSVEENLELACQLKGWRSMAERWQLANLLKKRPQQCSVGQRQRLTLIRALFSGHELLLCDEPLSGVDRTTKINVARDFALQCRDKRIACIWSTHDGDEAHAMGGTRVVLGL